MTATVAQHPAGTSSHPARGAWIEIFTSNWQRMLWTCRTPQGVRGLKSILMDARPYTTRVAPRKGCVD